MTHKYHTVTMHIHKEVIIVHTLFTTCENGKSWNHAMIPYVEWETGTCHTELTVERGREGRGMLEDVLLCKTTSLTVNAMTRGAGDSHMEQMGMLAGNFEFNP